jgi:hemerythrin-like domain-containing protein
MSQAIHVIKAEHRNLFRVVNVLDVIVRDMEGGAAPDFGLLDAILGYIEEFPDRYHHPKEDDYLFKRLRLREPAAAAILEELEDEHHLFAARMKTLKEALDAFRRGHPKGGEDFRLAVREYVRFQTKHLQKEEGVVLPMALRCLTAEDWAEIDAAFADNKDPLFGGAARDEARALYSRIVNMAPAPHGLAD